MSTYENTCPKCGDKTITEGWIPSGDEYRCPFCPSDLDAAWAWFRESDCRLVVLQSSDWECFGSFVGFHQSDTRDGAVLAAWRAATKQNKEKGEE